MKIQGFSWFSVNFGVDFGQIMSHGQAAVQKSCNKKLVTLFSAGTQPFLDWFVASFQAGYKVSRSKIIFFDFFMTENHFPM